jgi:putative ABC transport system ATP-binding protein
MDYLNLEIEEGEWVTIIGGNGSGKSTLMNVISGVHQLDSGSIYIDGEDVTKLPEHKRAKYLGRVFQDPNMGTAGMISIEENMSIASRRMRKNTLKWGFHKDERKKYYEMIKSLNLGLEDRLLQKVGLLSGGQRQAITLLMATLETPKILLLDEHTAALDPKTARIVLEITEKIVTENKLTTLMITHNMRDAIKYGDRLIMMYGGKIIYDVKGEEKKKLTVEFLLNKFEEMDKITFDN